jgi:hypothetical protein
VINYGFTLESGEKITRIVHRSLTSLLSTTGLAAFIAIVGIAFAYYETTQPYDVNFTPRTVYTLIAVLLTLAIIIFPIGIFVYERNVLIFTNMHLIEVEQNGLFGRNISELSYSRIQDATSDRNGVFSTILNYGTVIIQSAGEERNFIFRYAPNPEQLAEDIENTKAAWMHSQGLGTPGPVATPATTTEA